MLTLILIANTTCLFCLILYVARQKLKITKLEKTLQSINQRIKLENSASHGMGLQFSKLRSDTNKQVRKLRNQVIANDLAVKERQMRRGTKLKDGLVSHQEHQLIRKMSVTA